MFCPDVRDACVCSLCRRQVVLLEDIPTISTLTPTLAATEKIGVVSCAGEAAMPCTGCYILFDGTIQQCSYWLQLTALLCYSKASEDTYNHIISKAMQLNIIFKCTNIMQSIVY